VQICTWLGLFCMWIYFPVAVAHNVYGAEDQSSPLYAQGVEWAGICFGIYSAVCFVFSFALPWLARVVGRKTTHSVCLACGALGLISVAVIHDKNVLILSMLGVGMAWASTLSMPYVILSSAIPPERTGIYMGIFNFFIVTPEILAFLCFGWLMNHVLHNNRVAAVVTGGVFMLLAALLVQRVQEPRPALVKPIQAAA
jgi:maltose/moltooligosaccharide transporter